jgi:chaperonin cofactor prefoldin
LKESSDHESEVQENADEEDDDKLEEFGFDDESDENAEKFGTAEILALKKRTLAEIEEKLEKYDFRIDTIYKKDESYPKFLTLSEFYRDYHKQNTGFFTSARFKIDTTKSLINRVQFNEYLDNYSNREF